MNQSPRALAGSAAPPRQLTNTRIVLALAVAIAADGIQLLLGFWGWVGIDQVIDFLAMVVISLLIGFHPLFLPTFVAEFIPGLDLLPTWTGCVAFVVARKWKAQQQTSQPPPPPVSSRADIIDV